jgi:hypothetical protein
MGLDIRLPIGLMFLILGALLALFGLVGDHAIYARSDGIDVNLWWGLVLIAFGGVMLGLARRGMAASAAQSATRAEPPAEAGPDAQNP